MEHNTIQHMSEDPDQFTHLRKTQVKLLIYWSDLMEDEFKRVDTIEFSPSDSLFDMLTRRVEFAKWHQLNAIRRRREGGLDYQRCLYSGHHTAAVVRESVSHFQQSIQQNPSRETCTLVLQERSAGYVERTSVRDEVKLLLTRLHSTQSL